MMLEAEKRLVAYATKNMSAIQHSMEMARKMTLPISGMASMYEAIEKAAQAHARTMIQIDDAFRRFAKTSIIPYLDFAERLNNSMARTITETASFLESALKLAPIQEAFAVIEKIQTFKIPEEILQEHAKAFDRALQLAQTAEEALRKNIQQPDTVCTITDTVTEIAAELATQEEAAQLNVVLNNCIINIQRAVPDKWVQYAISFLMSILAGLFIMAFERGCDVLSTPKTAELRIPQEIVTIPRGWIMTTLDAIRADRKTSVTPSKTPDKQFELYSIPAYDSMKPEVVRGKTIGSSKMSVEAETVLLGKINPRINRVWIVGDHTKCEKIASTEWIPFFPVEGISPQYLSHYLSTQPVRDYLAQNVSGVGGSLMRIKPATLNGYDFPLPPLPEQHRIVAKIEELFSDLDAGITSLKKAKEQLKTYRQSVLKWAFEGKLTEEWRKQNTPEPASELLKRIKEEREKKYKEECEKAKKEGKRAPKKMKGLPPISAEELAELPVLPEGWEWVRIGSISNAIGGYAFSSKLFCESGAYQVVKIANVKMGHLPLESRPSFIDDVSGEIVEKYGLQSGDCVITLTGTRKKRDYGFVAMVTNQRNLLLNQRLGLLRFSQLVSAAYFSYALRSEHFQNRFFSHETGNVGQGNVGMAAITTETISLPPFDEQVEIVNAIETRISEADNLDKSIDSALAKSESLRQSILKQAFSGKLVPQDANDEPAENLLERIKASKSEQSTSARRTAPRRKAKQ